MHTSHRIAVSLHAVSTLVRPSLTSLTTINRTYRLSKLQLLLRVAMQPKSPPHPTFLKAASISFGVLFAAEWGDLSQLATAGLAARYDDPVSVFVGSWLALLVVSALAVFLGKKAADRAADPG